MSNDELIKTVLDTTSKFNERTIQIIGWVGGAIIALVTIAAGLSAFSLSAERDRLERASSALEEKFTKLSAELRNQHTDQPLIEVLSQADKIPLAGRSMPPVNIVESVEDGKTVYKLPLKYTLRNKGQGTAGRVWTKVYLESATLFSGEPDPDEPGYGVQANIPHTSWAGTFTGTSGDFPGGGFTTNVSSNMVIIENEMKKGRYRVLLKIYYGYPSTKVERVETYFELSSDWRRPIK